MILIKLDDFFISLLYFCILNIVIINNISFFDLCIFLDKKNLIVKKETNK